MWAVQEISSSCSAQGLTDLPFRNCRQMQHWNFTLGVPTLPSPCCLPLSLSYQFCLASNWISDYYFTTLPSHQSAFFLCVCVSAWGREKCGDALKKSNWKNWYLILCPPDYGVRIWTLLGGKTVGLGMKGWIHEVGSRDQRLCSNA